MVDSIRAAPPAMQRWFRQADQLLTDLPGQVQQNAENIKSLALPAKTVFINGATYGQSQGVVSTTYPASSSVSIVSTTGLMQITVSAVVQGSYGAMVGVGFYADFISSNLVAGVPLNGYSMKTRTTDAAAITQGGSFTGVFPCPLGQHTVSLFYQVDTTAANATASVLNAILVAKSV